MNINPMLTNLNQSRITQTLSPIKQMMQTLKAAGNPQMMLTQMASQNPQLKQVIEYVNANGGDAKSAFYKMANEKGVDPNEIIRQLNS